jgi:diguanylate cyclase (GGDEF)-like protein
MTLSHVDQRPPPTTGRVIWLLVLCALGAIGFTCGGGLVVYRNTRHMIEMRDWVEHSQTVLTDFQTQTDRLNTIDYSLQLYDATGESNRFVSAQNAVAAMHLMQLQLQELVRDNPSQTRHVHELDEAIAKLSSAVNGAGGSKTVPEFEIQQCKSIVNIMRQEERGLLKARSDESQSSIYRGLVVDAVYLGISLVILILLFAVLVRDALLRRSFERELSLANSRLKTSVQELEDRMGESSLLSNVRDELQLCVTSKQAQESALRHMEQLLPGTSGAVFILNNSRSMLEVAAAWNNPSYLLDDFEPDACCGLRAGKQRWRRPGQSELACNHFAGPAPETYACVPLAAQGETLGLIFIGCPTKEIASAAEARSSLIHEMAELASISIAGLNLRAKLVSQSIRDGLTGLFNRHFMEIALERELHRASRRRSSVAVLMLDVDHFKVINDTYSHEAGDVVLRQVAECFLQLVRDEDIVCRYGGEEFVIIFPDITEEFAYKRAEAIRAKIASINVPFRGESLRRITVSIGVAIYPQSAKEGNDLLRLADQALYQAKNNGRNQVRVQWSSSPVGSPENADQMPPSVEVDEGPFQVVEDEVFSNEGEREG